MRSSTRPLTAVTWPHRRLSKVTVTRPNGEYIQSAPDDNRARLRAPGSFETARREARTTMKRLITSLILTLLIGLSPVSTLPAQAQQPKAGGGPRPDASIRGGRAA